MEVVGFDVETTGDEEYFGLQPHRLREGRARITSMAVSDGAWNDDIGDFIVEYKVLRDKFPDQLAEWPSNCGVAKVDPSKEDIGRMLDTLAGKWVVGWNTQFDVAWLIAEGFLDKVLKVRWLDGRLAWRHWRSSPRGTELAPENYGLKDAVKSFKPDFVGYDNGVDFDDMSPAAVARRVTYNKLDAWLTVRIFNDLLRRLTPEQRRCMLLDSRAIVHAAQAMVEGIHLDASAAANLQEDLTTDAEEELVRLKIMSDEPVSEATLRSPQQLRELIFNDWALHPVSFTDTGSPSTDRAALMVLSEQDERCEHVWRSREAMANAVKFAENPLKVLDYTGNGKAYPSPVLYSTYTGRMTYGTKLQRKQPIGVPLHQWKRGKKYRQIIKPPPGYTLIELDWAGQEFRWMAVWSMDSTMLDMCAPGEDAHAFMASNIYNEDYRELMERVKQGEPVATARRKGGKVGNLSCQYRTGWRRLQHVARFQYDMPLTDVEAKSVHATYRVTYTGVPRYWAKQVKLGGEQGWVETMAGRRVQVGYRSSWHRDHVWGRESTCLNFPVQGTGADQKYLGMAVLADMLPEYDGRFYMELHDGLFYIVPDDKAEAAAQAWGKALSDLPYRKAWGKVFPIDFPVDVMMGPSWGELETVEIE